MREKPGLLRGALTALFIIHCIISSCFASAPTTLDPADWDGREFVLGGLDIDGRVIQLRGPVLQDYLTVAAGRVLKDEFDIDVSFRLISLNFDTTYSFVEDKTIDFIYTNPSAASCIESEFDAAQIVTLRNLRQGNPLNAFGGIAFARSDRDDINTWADFAGKILSGVSITGLGAWQMQALEALERGFDIWGQSSMVIFTGNQRKTVADVISGVVDVGFVRTDMAESMHNTVWTDGVSAGTSVSMDDIKIIEPYNPTVATSRQPGAKTGTPSPTELNGFPFPSSTPLYPEWSVAALPHVPAAVQKAVADALMALEGSWQHAAPTGDSWTEEEALDLINRNPGCSLENGGAGLTTTERDPDNNLPGSPTAPPPGSSPSNDGSYLCYYALRAIVEGKFVTWDPPISYLSLRDMQRSLGLLDDSTGSCKRSNDFYATINCPAGSVRKSNEEIDVGCANAGINCPDDPAYTCVCDPCKELPVSPISINAMPEGMDLAACEKMETCATFTSGNLVRVVVRDEWAGARGILGIAQPHNAYLRLSLGSRITCIQPPGTVVDCEEIERREAWNVPFEGGEFVFEFRADETGITVVQAIVDGAEIDVSPTLIVVNEAPSGLKPPVIAAIVCSCIAGVGLIALLIWWLLRVHQDMAWKIRSGETALVEPPVVLGRGAFGLVLLGTYRGTAVAVKRVLPPLSKTASTHALDVEGGTTSVNTGVHNSANFFKPVAARLKGRKDKDRSPARSLIADVLHGIRAASSVASRVGSALAPDKSSKSVAPDPRFAEARSSTVQPPLARAPSQNSKPDLWDAKPRQDSTLQPANSMAVGPRFTSFQPGMVQRVGSVTGPGQGGGQHSSTQGKTMDSSREIRKRALKDFRREIRLVSSLRHPNIITVMGACNDDSGDPMLVMEYMHRGSLGDVLANPSMVIEAEQAMDLIRDIASGMLYLHMSGITHGDLKSHNILVDSHMRGKVSDFGFSTKTKATRFAGTPCWMAPEVLRGEQPTQASDVYSFAVTAWELLTRRIPFMEFDPIEALSLVADDTLEPPFRPEIPELCPPALARLITECWHQTPARRPAFTEIADRLREMPRTDLQGLMGETQTVLREGRASEGGQYAGLPEDIRAALTSKGDAAFEKALDRVTLVFTDIVGYTSLSSQLNDAGKVSEMLNRLFSKFDAAAEAAGMVCIDVIGDAYMAIAGLNGESAEDQLKSAARFAIDVVRLAQETQISQEQPDLGMVRIRAGIHTGPATAAVIGARTKKFSVFGDTVNTAARMESLSHPLCIQMTEAAAKVLQSADPDGLAKGLKARGKIKVKGKGTMPTYWLLYEGCPDPAEVAPRSSQAGRHHKKSQDGDVAAAIRKAVDGNRSVSLARAPRNAGVQRAPTISMVRGWKAPSIPRTPRSNPAAGHAESSAAAAGQGAPQGDGVAGGVKGRGVAPGLKPVWESDEGGNESEEVEVDGEGVSAPAKRKPTRLMQASYAQEDGDDGKEANGRDA